MEKELGKTEQTHTTQDFLGRPVLKTVLSAQGERVWSVVWELRSHMPHSSALKKKNAWLSGMLYIGHEKCQALLWSLLLSRLHKGDPKLMGYELGHKWMGLSFFLLHLFWGSAWKETPRPRPLPPPPPTHTLTVFLLTPPSFWVYVSE